MLASCKFILLLDPPYVARPTAIRRDRACFNTLLTAFVKRYTYSALHAWGFPHILSYKIFSFCEQIVNICANDASGEMLQSAVYTCRKFQCFQLFFLRDDMFDCLYYIFFFFKVIFIQTYSTVNTGFDPVPGTKLRENPGDLVSCGSLSTYILKLVHCAYASQRGARKHICPSSGYLRF
jgi:hypothetical protein